MMTPIQVEAAKAACKKMMDDGYVSITVVDSILKMTGGVPERTDYEALRLLHCVNFKDYSQRLRVELTGLLQRVLSSPGMGVEVKFTALSRPPDLIQDLN